MGNEVPSISFKLRIVVARARVDVIPLLGIAVISACGLQSPAARAMD
jgi:hypothetical protein